MTDAPYGVRTLPKLYEEWSAGGMIANIGTRLVEIGPGALVLEGNLNAESHGFPTSRGPIVHGGAIATLPDETLASVAFTVAEEGETTTTADLKVDYYRPGRLGPAHMSGKGPSPDAEARVLRGDGRAGNG